MLLRPLFARFMVYEKWCHIAPCLSAQTQQRSRLLDPRILRMLRIEGVPNSPQLVKRSGAALDHLINDVLGCARCVPGKILQQNYNKIYNGLVFNAQFLFDMDIGRAHSN